ncbi:hypothetical protein [Pleionea sp. CnH1-48]|uniref:hypothetical protein n=1 Tax=Pleionea sp. CnH1-48 TaxID=2954494 RepID=UPI0020977EF8|nr:hypothetical protein [Pleionea sp. CnH1-48]MCO7224605.1 hypothetical protein [Pleionea sp. CnH1-48]
MKKFNTLAIASSIAATLFLVGCTQSVERPDLDRVLDVTSDTLYSFENSAANTKDDKAVDAFVKELASNMNKANPKVYADPVGIMTKEDGAFVGFQDPNQNMVKDSGEEDLFTVEIDSEKNRLMATDATGAMRDHSFSGAGLLAGFILGSMLSRQRAAGVNPKSLSSRQATSRSAYQSARSRSGSGSHSSGK